MQQTSRSALPPGHRCSGGGKPEAAGLELSRKKAQPFDCACNMSGGLSLFEHNHFGGDHLAGSYQFGEVYTGGYLPA